MITSIAQFITGYLLKNKIIESNKLDIYIYGFEILISNMLGFLIGLTLGIAFSQILECLVFLLIFVLMRTYCGGYHAETYLKCNIIFTTNIMIAMLIFKFIVNYPVYFHFMINIICIISIVILAPVENEYKPITSDEKKRHKKTSIILYLIIFIISSILYFFISKYSIVIDIALISVALSMVIEVFRKGRVLNEKSNS